jgi:hypothetical protein
MPNPEGEQRVSFLLPIAVKLVTLVRDDDPEANARWLNSHNLTATDYRDICILLAAMVREDVAVSEATAWLLVPRKVQAQDP